MLSVGEKETGKHLVFLINLKMVVNDKMELSFRKAQNGDVDYLLRLRTKTMNEHIISSGQVIYEKDQLDRVLFHFDDARIICYKDIKIGLLKTVQHPEYIEIIQIQIDPEFQGKGIGRFLIMSIIDEAHEKGQIVTLSVLKKQSTMSLPKIRI